MPGSARRSAPGSPAAAWPAPRRRARATASGSRCQQACWRRACRWAWRRRRRSRGPRRPRRPWAPNDSAARSCHETSRCRPLSAKAWQRRCCHHHVRARSGRVPAPRVSTTASPAQWSGPSRRCHASAARPRRAALGRLRCHARPAGDCGAARGSPWPASRRAARRHGRRSAPPAPRGRRPGRPSRRPGCCGPPLGPRGCPQAWRRRGGRRRRAGRSPTGGGQRHCWARFAASPRARSPPRGPYRSAAAPWPGPPGPAGGPGRAPKPAGPPEAPEGTAAVSHELLRPMCEPWLEASGPRRHGFEHRRCCWLHSGHARPRHILRRGAEHGLAATMPSAPPHRSARPRRRWRWPSRSPRAARRSAPGRRASANARSGRRSGHCQPT
mmetsp:Transcript_123778/g.396154  ORF Transcript_123778/g.396154 Transcript_123778/m.396154 type:complete len:384 (+) Transcript_123778:1061-2212(+)